MSVMISDCSIPVILPPYLLFLATWIGIEREGFFSEDGCQLYILPLVFTESQHHKITEW